MTVTRRRLLAAGALGGGIVLPGLDLLLGDLSAQAQTAPGPAPATPPTLEDLYEPARLPDVALSPDGSRIAKLRNAFEKAPPAKPSDAKKGGAETTRRMAYVALMKSQDLSVAPQIVRIGDYDVEQVEWASDDRLLIWLRVTKNAKGEPIGLWYDSEFYPIPVGRVLSCSVSGGSPAMLFGNQTNAVRREFDLASVVDMLHREPDMVMMQRWETARERYSLYRVNVVTGEATLAEAGETQTDGWFLQDGVPVLRFDSNFRGTTFSIFGRAPGETRWTLIRKTRRDELKRFAGLDVVGSTPEPGVLMVSHRAEDEEFRGLRTFDLRTLQLGPALRSAEKADVTGVVTDETNRLIATAYEADRKTYLFEDASLAAHFRGLNTYYKNECSLQIYDMSLDRQHMLLRVTGPRRPGTFAYYNTRTRRLEDLGDQYPGLAADRLARMETLKISCRDGQAITAFLSHPIGESRPRPLVVLPHGGPEVRDYFQYSDWVQALCAQGWLVLQPNFRGSGGYGRSFGDAGRKHWGSRMQEDVEDAVAQVVASGLADPKRLAIMGASYGGYAAMMGVVRKPDLYRCAVAIAGDFDLQQSLAFTRREDGADSFNYAYWVASMGDPKTDAELLKVHSPRQRLAEIKVPVMMIHGSEDRIVAADQSRDMAKALKKAGKVHEYIELKGEGHRGWSRENEMLMLRNAIRFITAALPPGQS